MMFSVLSLIAFISAGVFDLASYYRLGTQNNLFSIDVHRTDNVFTLTLNNADGDQQHQFMLDGDQWQLDYRVIRFSTSYFMLSNEHMIKFTRISNRYDNESEQMTRKRYVYPLEKTPLFVPDMWQFFHSAQQYLPFIDSAYGGAVFVPLIDGAEYSVQIGFAGITVKADNDIAKTAIVNWQ